MGHAENINTREESAFIRGAGALAKLLGVHEISVRRWMRQHRIPYTKLGGVILFRRADIDNTIARLTVPAVGAKRSKKRAVEV